MSRKGSAAAARKQLNPTARWGRYLLAGGLLVAVLGAADRMQATPAAPEPFAAAGATSSAGGVSGSAPTLYAHGDRLRPLVEEAGNAQTLNIYGPGGRIIGQVGRDGSGGQEVRHLLADHLGSTQAVRDSEGNVVAQLEYGPYGKSRAAGTAATKVRYRYTGHPWDESQGLYQTPARGYDPTQGRFLSVDPQREDASPYPYAGDDPINFVDPTGDIKTVPLVIQTGMADHVDQRIMRSIGKALGMSSKQKIVDARKFFGATTEEAGRVYYTKLWKGYTTKNYTRKFKFNSKIYWFVGDEIETKAAVPGNIMRRTAGFRKSASERFAADIVLIDISSTGDAHAWVAKALDKAKLKYSVVRIENTTTHYTTDTTSGIASGYGVQDVEVDEIWYNITVPDERRAFRHIVKNRSQDTIGDASPNLDWVQPGRNWASTAPSSLLPDAESMTVRIPIRPSGSGDGAGTRFFVPPPPAGLTSLDVHEGE